MALAAADDGTRTLVISTDPAPSLGDAFRQPLAAAPRRITPSLHAVEVNASRALDRWLAERREALERVVLRGTWLDEEDVARLLRLSLPGIDELAALLEISRFGRSGTFDLIVVDTAPTGHTLRMLSMPETLLAVSRVFDRMQGKHRVMVEALRGGWRPDTDDRLIEEMAEEAGELAALLRDRERTAMTWVTLPEPMAVEETADAAAALEAQGVALADIILNRVTQPPPSSCRWCDARRAFEAGAIEALRKRLPRTTLRVIHAQDREPVGVRALRRIARDGNGDSPDGNGDSPLFPRDRWTGNGDSPLFPQDLWKKGAVPISGASTVGAPTAFMMFGGKGGVGKTTCAAAAAIAAATAEPDRRVLLISTDPAHSLADVLGVRLSDTPRRIPSAPPNLTVRELDATAGFARVRERYRAAIDAVFDRFTRNSAFDATQDRRVMHDLIELAPPGVDELIAVIDVMDAAVDDRRGSSLVVVDTAPSGHALRLLEMPALVQDWTKALMALLLKYQPVVGLGELGPVLLKLSQGLGRLRTLLSDPAQTHFIVVSRPAALPRAETTRLLKKLSRLRIHVPAVVVNAAGAGTCSRCERQRGAELKEITALRRALRSQPKPTAIVIAPGRMPPPHGAEGLATWARGWRAAK